MHDDGDVQRKRNARVLVHLLTTRRVAEKAPTLTSRPFSLSRLTVTRLEYAVRETFHSSKVKICSQKTRGVQAFASRIFPRCGAVSLLYRLACKASSISSELKSLSYPIQT